MLLFCNACTRNVAKQGRNRTKITPAPDKEGDEPSLEATIGRYCQAQRYLTRADLPQEGIITENTLGKAIETHQVITTIFVLFYLKTPLLFWFPNGTCQSHT